MGQPVPFDDLPENAVPEEDLPTYSGSANPTANLAPQAVTVGKEMAPAAGNLLKQGAQYVANKPLATTAVDIAGLLSHGLPYGSLLDQAKNVLSGTGPTVGEALTSAKNMVTGGSGSLAQGAKAAGGAIARGLVAPESAFAAPYQMAAYEQEKIRANPNAPEYANNPYAMQQRGQAATQGAAGAMNQRQAVAGQQYGGISAEDQARLEDDQAKRMIRYAALKKALGL